jgi:hypothetical protein
MTRRRVPYTPPPASRDLSDTQAGMVRAAIIRSAGVGAAREWDAEWRKHRQARRGALRHAAALGRTHGRANQPRAYDLGAVADPVAQAYLTAYDRALAP